MYLTVTLSTNSLANNAVFIAMDAGTNYDIVSLKKCRNESDFDRQLKLLLVINAMLPPTKKLHVPALLTDDYISRALHEIEKALASNF